MPRLETVIDNLPGYPDSINLASDGNYWLALVGMRSPARDLAWRMPGFRKRVGKRVPIDERLFPNINTACVTNSTSTAKCWIRSGTFVEPTIR